MQETVTRTESQDRNAAEHRASFILLLADLGFLFHSYAFPSYWTRESKSKNTKVVVFLTYTRTGFLVEVEVYQETELIDVFSHVWLETNNVDVHKSFSDNILAHL